MVNGEQYVCKVIQTRKRGFVTFAIHNKLDIICLISFPHAHYYGPTMHVNKEFKAEATSPTTHAQFFVRQNITSDYETFAITK